MNCPIETAKSAWRADIPEWVYVMAAACADTSQRKVADKIGRSGALVNQVLKNKYTGDLGAVKALVEGVFMNGTLTCPALGEIPTSDCQKWREKSRAFSNAHSLRVRMYRACNGCPKNKKGRYHE